MVLCTDLSYNNFSDFEKLFTTLESYSEVLDLDEIIFANDFERNNPVNMNEWNY